MSTHRNYGARVRIWDSGDSFADRYTILPPRTAGADWLGSDRTWQGIASGAHPFHPLGFGQHCEASYRLRGPYGWIMIGAACHGDAMREAARSTRDPKPENLEVWDGTHYVPAEALDRG